MVGYTAPPVPVIAEPLKGSVPLEEVEEGSLMGTGVESVRAGMRERRREREREMETR